MALGERWTGSETSDLIDAASTAAVAVLLLAYHLRVFQRDAALAKLDDASAADAPADSATPVAEPYDRVTLIVVQSADRSTPRRFERGSQRLRRLGPPFVTVAVPEDEARALLDRLDAAAAS